MSYARTACFVNKHDYTKNIEDVKCKTSVYLKFCG